MVYILPALLSIILLSPISAFACGCGCDKNNNAVSTQQQTPDVQEGKVECPVMRGHWFLPSEAADSTEYNGKTYYFCCGGCKEQFLKNPGFYINSEIES